jgi:ketosteroid isomerase-like protein
MDAAVDVAHSYHHAWTSKRFADAANLLAPDLTVEVPVNHYPTRESFAQALAAFGALATRVTLLCQVGDAEEAMLLYDMDVEGLGCLRVAEHFTVADRQITRLRQIHDTAALRSAGFVQNP